MRRITIARVIARLNIGGPAIHTVLLSKGLNPERFDTLLVTGVEGPCEGSMLDWATAQGVEPCIIPELGREINLVDDLRALSKLYRLFQQEQPHIVHTHTAKAGFVGRLAARLAGVPLVLHTFHGHVFHSYFGPPKTRFFLAVERALARFTDRIIAISPAQRHDIVHVYRIAPPDKVLMIPLGLDLEPFATAKKAHGGRFRAAAGIPPDAPLAGFVGRLTHVKNPSLFVQAARRVVQQIPQAHFVFVGDGELRADLDQQVAALGLAQRVIFAGWQADMPAVYADLDLLALTSLNEGTPVTLIESLATGTPVVATDVGGVSDVVIDQQTGLLVPSRDVASLAQAITRLLRNPEGARALALAGQKNVLGRFGLARLIDDMESLYLGLLAEKGMPC